MRRRSFGSVSGVLTVEVQFSTGHQTADDFILSVKGLLITINQGLGPVWGVV
jgi:hypothetical protein